MKTELVANVGKRGRLAIAFWVLILSLGMIAIPTNAYFSNRETSTGNTFAAGTWENGDQELAPTDDSFVLNSRPEMNFGWMRGLVVMNRRDRIAHCFLKFDLSELPEDASISSAELHLLGIGIPPPKATPIAVKFVENDAWSEEEITWSNMPPAAEELDSENVQWIGWYCWDVTSKTREEFENDKVLSLMLCSGENAVAFFGSKEFRFEPYLEVVYISNNPTSENSDDGRPFIEEGVFNEILTEFEPWLGD